MTKLKTRITISISQDVVELVDSRISNQSRSAYIESLLRRQLTERAWLDYARDITPQEQQDMLNAASESEEATMLTWETDEV